MTPAEAAWVREHVWTTAMREASQIGMFVHCICRFWKTDRPCERGRHFECYPPPADLPNYALIGDLASRATTERVWQYESCRWACDCPCHSLTQLDAVPAPPVQLQLDLFEAAPT